MAILGSYMNNLKWYSKQKKHLILKFGIVELRFGNKKKILDDPVFK